MAEEFVLGRTINWIGLSGAEVTLVFHVAFSGLDPRHFIFQIHLFNHDGAERAASETWDAFNAAYTGQELAELDDKCVTLPEDPISICVGPVNGPSILLENNVPKEVAPDLYIQMLTHK